MTRWSAVAGLTVLLAATLGGCGDATSTAPGAEGSSSPAAPAPSPTAVPVADGEVITRYAVTVLDDGGGAELCLGGVADSLPPQCGGPELVGWDWTQHRGDFEHVGDVRWGEFLVRGTFDGTSVTPTKVTPADDVPQPPAVEGEDQFATPCPEPAGGWVVDPGKVGEADRNRVFRVAEGLPDYATSWVDYVDDPRTLEEQDDAAAAGERQPPPIIDVRVTGDPAAAEARLREVWGGGLCVASAEHTDAELRRVQDRLDDVPGFLGSGSGIDLVLGLQVVYDDGSMQTWADQEFGEGLVDVESALTLVDE